MKPRLLFIGDAVAATGFACSTHHILDIVCQEYDVTVLGLNYSGDPHSYPYPIYPCLPGGDHFGIRRVKEMVARVEPDIVLLQQDPWNFQEYVKRIDKKIPIVGIVAVDGKNCKGTALNDLAHCIFWTQFAQQEAQRGGYCGQSFVIPLGVDLDIYHPMNRTVLRQQMCVSEDAFIVGVVGRNQQRKRLDLTLAYFAEWLETRHVENALLWMHVAPTADQAYDLEQLAEYYGIANHVILPEVEEIHGLSEHALAQCYNVFDIGWTTTQGEGWGLPQLEMMACGIPQLVPAWSALGEWTKDAAVQVSCTSTAATPSCINVIGGIADKEETIDALDNLYRRAPLRQHCSERGLALAAQPQFRWDNIGRAVQQVLDGVLKGETIPC